MSRAVVLLSGGLDSATTLAVAVRRDRCERVVCLSFDYGQRHSLELDCARYQARAFNATNMVVDLPGLGVLPGSALTDDRVAVPKHDSVDELDSSVIPPTYMPGRNTIMLAYALAYAEVAEADAVYLGVNALDYSGYPDCRPEYIKAFQAVADLSSKRAVEGEGGPRLVTPLIDLTKAATIALGRAFGVDYAHTHSCYDPQPYDPVDASDPRTVACGRCDSCLLRLRAFAELGIADPVDYVRGAADTDEAEQIGEETMEAVEGGPVPKP